jgi:hypothetical protein
VRLRHIVAASVLVVTIPLSGCGTVAQQQFQTMQAGLASNSANLEACVERERARPEFAPLLSHLPALKGRLYPTAAQLADVTYPTAEEARLLAQFTTNIAGCENAYRASVAALLPAAAPANDRLVADIDGVLAQWIARKVTWGEGARQINQIYVQDEPAVQAAAGATVASLKAAHQQELAERQARGAALMAIGGVLLEYGHATRNIPSVSVAPAHEPAVIKPTNCNGRVGESGNVNIICN